MRVGYAGSVDSDSDGVFDSADNCPGVYNPPSGSPAAQSDSPPFQIGNDCRDLAPFAFTPLANDQFDGAETMSFGASGEDQVATISGAQLGEASTDNEDSFLPRSSFQINHTLWYRFTATASGAVTVNAKDANSARTNAAVAK